MILLTLVDDMSNKEVGYRKWPVCPQVDTHIAYDGHPWLVKSVTHSDWTQDPENGDEIIAEVYLYVDFVG